MMITLYTGEHYHPDMAMELEPVMECLGNPLKARVMIMIKEHGPLTAKQMLSYDSKIPQASLYRALKSMEEHSILVTVAGSLVVQLMASRLNVMGTGDESARTLGVNVDKERLLLLILVTVVAATVVSFTGVIGFVGLVAPHVARIIVGSDNKYLVPAAGVFGALLLLLADMASRILADSVLPVGVITACIGGPVFILLILRSSKEAWR